MGKDSPKKLRDDADLQFTKSSIEYKFGHYNQAGGLCESAANNILTIPKAMLSDDDYVFLFKVYDRAQLYYAAAGNAGKYNEMIDKREMYPDENLTQLAIQYIEMAQNSLDDFDLDKALGYIKYMAIPELTKNIARHESDHDCRLLLECYTKLVEICNHELKNNLHGILKDDLLLKEDYMGKLKTFFKKIKNPSDKDKDIYLTYFPSKKVEVSPTASITQFSVVSNNVSQGHRYDLRPRRGHKR